MSQAASRPTIEAGRRLRRFEPAMSPVSHYHLLAAIEPAC